MGFLAEFHNKGLLLIIVGVFLTACQTTEDMSHTHNLEAAVADPLSRCETPLGSVRLFEDESLPWFTTFHLKYPNLGSTLPLLRLMVEKSGCLDIVSKSGTNSPAGLVNFSLSPQVHILTKRKDEPSMGEAFLDSVSSLFSNAGKKGSISVTLLLSHPTGDSADIEFNGRSSTYDLTQLSGLSEGKKAASSAAFFNTLEGRQIYAAMLDAYAKLISHLQQADASG
ncbi:hypothetical protein P2G88_09655 [Aliiglaciecola sp. CAU 1673]|uniref:hypothetical protein n=1 Tax=Aliiglaciecola sp. CAU 1673 TaxID=3032595 RepID=UPI0023DCB047|nr:hypothetical protein [Aliiglaciecola sp. CAU 1673]MDF2178518.1 hypothetical protein [Aliiglaciecola sp. CAU 1673]